MNKIAAMRPIQLHLMIVAVYLFVIASLNAKLLPAGKGKGRQPKAYDVTIEQLFSPSTWNMAYVTDTDAYANIDHGQVNFYKDLLGNVYISYEAVLDDNSRVTFVCKFYKFGKCFYEICVDDKGNSVRFRDCALYLFEGRAGYYYRYVDSDGATLTDKELQFLLQLDASYFGGKLKKLPNKNV